MPTTPRTALALLLFIGLGFAWTPSAQAEQRLDVEVQTIYAHDDGEHVDSVLEPLREELIATFAHTHFQHLETRRFTLGLKESNSITLPDEEATELELAYRGTGTEESGLVRLGLALKGKLSTEVEAAPGATFFQAGLVYRDGILILAIRTDLVD